MLKHKDKKTILAVTKKASQKKIDLIKAKGHQVVIVRESAGKTRPVRKKSISKSSNGVNMKSLMKELAKLGITSVMIEGGSRINASALSGKIVDKVMIFTAYKIIGGTNAICSIGGECPPLLKQAVSLEDPEVRAIGADILFEGYV